MIDTIYIHVYMQIQQRAHPSFSARKYNDNTLTLGREIEVHINGLGCNHGDAVFMGIAHVCRKGLTRREVLLVKSRTGHWV